MQAIWHFDGIYTTSRHIPGVRFAGVRGATQFSETMVG